MPVSTTSPLYAFCGNRFNVLEAMLKSDIQVKYIAATSGSYLEKLLQQTDVPHNIISSKGDLRAWLGSMDFDVLVSNGCGYRIPVEDYPGKQFINIHPSYLPDLRGVDPIPGAILFGRDSGATCHVMSPEFDTGDIISQKRIPYDPAFTATTLYPLCFETEAEMFKMALARDFAINHPQQPTGNEISYKFDPKDLVIDFSEDATAIIRRVRAFNNPNKLARFTYKDDIITVHTVDPATLATDFPEAAENEIVAVDGNRLVIKKPDGLLALYVQEGAGQHFTPGIVLS